MCVYLSSQTTSEGCVHVVQPEAGCGCESDTAETLCPVRRPGTVLVFWQPEVGSACCQHVFLVSACCQHVFLVSACRLSAMHRFFVVCVAVMCLVCMAVIYLFLCACNVICMFGVCGCSIYGVCGCDICGVWL